MTKTYTIYRKFTNGSSATRDAYPYKVNDDIYQLAQISDNWDTEEEAEDEIRDLISNGAPGPFLIIPEYHNQ